MYETMGWVHLEREETGQVDSVRTHSVLELSELAERLSQQLYSVHGILEEDDDMESHREVVDNWMGHVRGIIEPLADELPEQIVKKKGRP